MSLNNLKSYLADPFLDTLFSEIKTAGPLRSILVDITHTCNVRCDGCYFFAEDMDRFKSPKDESIFDASIQKEKQRGTNFVTATGGQPSLKLDGSKSFVSISQPLSSLMASKKSLMRVLSRCL